MEWIAFSLVAQSWNQESNMSAKWIWLQLGMYAVQCYDRHIPKIKLYFQQPHLDTHVQPIIRILALRVIFYQNNARIWPTKHVCKRIDGSERCGHLNTLHYKPKHSMRFTFFWHLLDNLIQILSDHNISNDQKLVHKAIPHKTTFFKKQCIVSFYMHITRPYCDE